MIKTKVDSVIRARLEQGYSQANVCKATGINASTYCRIENGIVNPRPSTAKKICDCLQKPFSELFEIYKTESNELVAI